jgi:hypothetical protein
MTSARIRVTLVRMRLVCAVAMAALLVLASCSGDSGDEADFDGEPIVGRSEPESTSSATTAPDEDPARVELDPAAEDAIVDPTVPAPDEEPRIDAISAATSFRTALEQGGLPDDRIDCLVDSVSGMLGMTEAELDQMVVSDPSNAWLTVAGQLAATECLSSGLPTGGPEGRIVIPEDTSGTLADQLASTGLTPSEAQCLADLYGDPGTAAENKDFLSCISLDRLIQIAG